MWYIALIIVFIILLLLIVNMFFKNKKLHEKLDIKVQDFERVEKRWVLESEAILKINNNLNSELEHLKTIISKKTMESKQQMQLNQILNNVMGELSNIDVIANDKPTIKEEPNNLKEEIETLFAEISMNCSNRNIKFELEIKNNIDTDFIYDNKLIMALKLIILKSIEDRGNCKLKIVLEEKSRVLSKSLINISIENIDFTDYSGEFEKIYNLLNIDSISPNILDCRIDSNFLIIRQNLLAVSKKISFAVNSKKHSMIIELELNRVRKKRKNIKALVVDDQKNTAEMNQEVLKSINIESDIALSGEECIKVIKENYEDYDIIITDNQMPNMNGTELIKELKKIEGFNLPVIIVTGDSNKNNMFTEYYGFDGYIQKPLNKEKAKTEIKKLIK